MEKAQPHGSDINEKLGFNYPTIAPYMLTILLFLLLREVNSLFTNR